MASAHTWSCRSSPGPERGVLAVASTIPGQYSDADAGLLQEAANQIGLAIENMKAYERSPR